MSDAQVKLPWARAVAAGVVSESEADLLVECVGKSADGAWWVDLGLLDDGQRHALERAVVWFTSAGGVQ